MKRTFSPFSILLLTSSILLLTFSIAFSYLQYPKLKKFPVVLKVPFKTAPYRLILKLDVKEPKERDRRVRLFAKYKQQEIMLNGPADLLKLIPMLQTKAEALAFVRLFTDGYTHKYFIKPAALEVFIATNKNLHLLNDDRYGFGLVHPKRAKELSLLPPRIKRTENGFIIQRNLVFYPTEKQRMHFSRVNEHIDTRAKTYELAPTALISNEDWIGRFLVDLSK